MSDRPIFDPADFRLPPGIAHVCAAGETPFLHRHDAALARYAADKSLGWPGRATQEAEVARARAQAARLFGMAPGDIGLVANVAEGVALVMDSLDWREGDNICIDPAEYASVVAPAALRRHPGVALRFAPMRDPAAVARAVDGRTRVIAVSAVSYLNAARHDLAALRRVADSVGALLLVDFTQGAGWLPIEASVADFAFSAGYKWLLGMTGTAIACWNRARQPDWAPASGGWYSIVTGPRPDYAAGLALAPDALRFTRGNPAHGPVYVLNEALAYLAQHETSAIERHVQQLTVALLAGLAEAGIPSITPPDPRQHGASVCVEHPAAPQLIEQLQARGVWAWNGRGRLRFSFHGYNSMADVARILAALREIWV